MSNHLGRNTFLPKALLLEELRRILALADDEPLTIRRYYALGGIYSHTSLINRCGSWARAKADARGAATEDSVTEEGQTKRPCLRCDRLFWSEGNWNRLCEDCGEAVKADESADVRIYRIPYQERIRPKTSPGDRWDNTGVT